LNSATHNHLLGALAKAVVLEQHQGIQLVRGILDTLCIVFRRDDFQTVLCRLVARHHRLRGRGGSAPARHEHLLTGDLAVARFRPRDDRPALSISLDFIANGMTEMIGGVASALRNRIAGSAVRSLRA